MLKKSQRSEAKSLLFMKASATRDFLDFMWNIWLNKILNAIL